MIWSLLGGILARFWQPIAAAIAAYRLAKVGEQNKRLKAENKAMRTAKEVRDEVEGKRPDAVSRDLDRWMRD